MTEAKPCFCGGRAVLGPIPQDGSDAEVQFVHATGCPRDIGPNAAPKASEAQVEEKCATCGREEVWHRGSMHGFRKPAPAPEPKQGSEEPIDWEAADRFANYMADSIRPAYPDEKEVARAFLALRADQQDWRKGVALIASSLGEKTLSCSHLATKALELRAEVEKYREGITAPIVEFDALRAQLAAADENLKTMLQAAGEEAERQLAAEKARADRAEARVKVLEDVVVNANRVGWNEALSMEASSINAARARKEGGSR